ncbi:MAG: arsenite methyltransferase [Bacteroidales bacterium]|nr:arsenite methyltransferase [Bacteroidales bacterium]
MAINIKESIKQAYSSVLKRKNSCGCNSSCCSSDTLFTFSDTNYKKLDGYQQEADYLLGCGLPLEAANIKEGSIILDLGCGAGNDVFIASKMVGDKGKVIGIDFTEAMIKKANEIKDKLNISNVEFILADIEQLPIVTETIDVVISNCVLNLVPDKEKAFKEIFRVLKKGGIFSISDIVLNTTLPTSVKSVVDLYVGCISGAIMKSEYLKIIKQVGFSEIEIKKEQEITLPDEYFLRYINKEEINEFKRTNNAIQSITITAKK